ncbi:uncharacterized protein LOC132301292 [Cornus florida]|uniref:uncharacterized protein LOC132301292 n=1 Tax=Cornus florida TaxID=4283 RepID=UPI00289F6C96|nr:uncharacterized protein LOC132301292 [Cornus florida]
MTDVETRYNKAEKIILALVYTKRKFRHYFESITSWNSPTTLYKLYSLSQIYLEELPKYEDKPEETELPEPHWELRVDGSSNQASAGVGIIISTPEGTKLQQSICLNFPATNNEAEYEALLAGLRLANQLQVTGKYQPKEKRMKAHKEAVESATRGFDQIEFYQVPRDENAEIDQLAASSSDEDLIRIVPIDILDKPSISPQQEKAEARKLKLTAAKYSIINNQLYRKSFSGPYLKCLSPTKALVILKQIHDGDCGNHSSGRSLAHKVLTQGYFWPYLAWNAEEYARRCDKCQRYGPMKHQSAEDLHAMANPWPFAQWRIDMVGPLPKTVEQKEYALLATYYFTKWVKAEACSSVTHE